MTFIVCFVITSRVSEMSFFENPRSSFAMYFLILCAIGALWNIPGRIALEGLVSLILDTGISRFLRTNFLGGNQNLGLTPEVVFKSVFSDRGPEIYETRKAYSHSRCAWHFS